jgi:hypothetical protein
VPLSSFPPCNIEVMNLHLAEISSEVAPGRLKVTANITLMALPPPKCPERNPAANVWQFIRDYSLPNRIFKPYEDILDHCCSAWNKLIDQPWRIKSIGLRDWVHASCTGEMAVNKL